MAWDDIKGAGDTIPSAEWNTHVTDQKNRVSKDGGDTITVDDTDNVIPLTIVQNDTTNNPDCLRVTNTGSGDALDVTQDNASGHGVRFNVNSSGDTRAIEFGGSTVAWRIERDSGDSSLYFRFGSSGDRDLVIENTGSGDAELFVDGCIHIADGMTAPGTTSGRAKIYVDSSDGDLKIKFGDGTVKTIVTDS